MIEILIADDHAVFREGLGRLLEAAGDLRVTGEAADSREAIRLARERRPGVVLLDLDMPGRGGLETLQELKRLEPGLKVLILTAHREDHFAIRCLRQGAQGYITKASASQEIVAAVRKISAGGLYLSEGLAQQLALSLQGKAGSAPHESLSDRELQVLTLIGAGKTVSEIGEELVLSVKTISTYRSRILEKTGFRNNAEIMRYAVGEGLVQ